ncbi:pickpocket protein 28 [Ochlerotatus camptorhynchus]|uniref:pickpocket protein 28 n=1 Tax=Ochlerotatus camptorhynchus TaxID=644619 RepID=UPI0031E16290
MRIPNERLFRKTFNGPSSRLLQFGKSKSPKLSFTENFREYCLNTTIHGLKYVGTISLSIMERSFFSISFILVAALSIYFITNVYQKWQSSPIIIGLSPTATHIKEISFPAVTICNMNQATRSAAEVIEHNSVEEAVLNSICSLDGEYNLTNYEGKWSTVRTMLFHVTQPCRVMVKACRYAQKVHKCEHMFRSVLTDEGLCCTFNSVDQAFLLWNKDIAAVQGDMPDNPFQPIEWTPEGGFVGEQTNVTFPRAIAGTGANMGLTVVLDANVQEYFCSSTSSYGFKLMLHNPMETPKMAEFAHYIQVGTENRIIVTPILSDASYLIRKASQAQRQCVFANEANLSYFRTYSRNNCEMECEARLIQENCGCVLYYMPKLKEDTKICSKGDAACYEKIRSSIALTANTTLICSCLPGCSEIAYTMDLSTADLCVGRFKVRESLLDVNESYARENIALVYIFFSEMYFRSFTKGELIGFTDFLSNIGGLLGLFMGFSLISVAEVFYFVTLRPLFAKRKEIQHRTNQEAPVRDRQFNTVYNNVFQIPQKVTQQHHVHFADNDQNEVNQVRNLPKQLKVLISSRVQQITGWVENAFRLRRKTANRTRKISTLPFYE